MVSLNQIVSRINEVADEHYMLKTFQCGNLSQIAEIDSQDDLVYPLAYLDRRSASSTGGAFFFNFDLIITDLVKTDRSNEQEVISDCMQIAQDFAVLLERPEYLNISDTAWLNPTQTINYSIISEEYSDRVAGVVMSFQIKQAFTYNRCVTPVTGNSNCQSAPTCTDTINSLGADYYDCVLPSYDFTTSRVQNAVTAQQQTDLSDWLCGASSGIAYRRPIITGQTTSYRNGDEGWNLTNGVYDYTPPTSPVSIANLDTTVGSPFLTLKENNTFGNKNRFTDDAGGQTYANDYVIDHLTGLGWYRVDSSAIWNTAIDNAQSSTQNGFNDWRIPNDQELTGIDNKELANVFNYAPFNLTATTLWTCTTFKDSTTFSYRSTDTGVFGAQAKTASQGYILVRNHYS